MSQYYCEFEEPLEPLQNNWLNKIFMMHQALKYENSFYCTVLYLNIHSMNLLDSIDPRRRWLVISFPICRIFDNPEPPSPWIYARGFLSPWSFVTDFTFSITYPILFKYLPPIITMRQPIGESKFSFILDSGVMESCGIDKLKSWQSKLREKHWSNCRESGLTSPSRNMS